MDASAYVFGMTEARAMEALRRKGSGIALDQG